MRAGEKMPQFSVVIPVYNRAEIVESTLNSVIEQTYSPFEIIIVDNNSNDSSLAVIERWKAQNENASNRITILNEERQGASAARNRGAEIAQGDWLFFMDSDDRIASNLFEILFKEIAQNPSVELLFWNMQDSEGRTISKHRVLTPKGLLGNQIYNSVLCTVCFAVKKDVYERCGGWNPNLLVWNDWEFGIRLLLNNVKYRHINDFLTIKYNHSESITGDEFHSRRGEWERSISTVETIINNCGIDDADRCIDMINYRRAVLAAQYSREGFRESGKSLLKDALRKGSCRDSLYRRGLLTFLYHYKRFGGRGGYFLW